MPASDDVVEDTSTRLLDGGTKAAANSLHSLALSRRLHGAWVSASHRFALLTLRAFGVGDRHNWDMCALFSSTIEVGFPRSRIFEVCEVSEEYAG